MVEGADEVLSLWEVNGGLAAYCGVHHGEQGCGNLREGDSAQEGRRDESGEVADHSAADGYDEVSAFGFERGQPVKDALGGVEGLVLFALRDEEQVGRDSGAFHGHLGAARLVMRSVVGDDVGGGRGDGGLDALA